MKKAAECLCLCTLNANQAVVTDIGKEEVERVSELVEEGCHLVECKQRRSALCRAGEVADDAHHRSNALALAVVARAANILEIMELINSVRFIIQQKKNMDSMSMLSKKYGTTKLAV